MQLRPSDRSLAKVVSALGHKSDSLVQKWSARYNWVMRVKDYDAYMQRSAVVVQEFERVDAIKQYNKIETEKLTVLQMILDDTIRTYLDRTVTPDPLTISRLVKAQGDLATLFRRSLGLPTQFTSEGSDHDPNDDTQVYTLGVD